MLNRVDVGKFEQVMRIRGRVILRSKLSCAQNEAIMNGIFRLVENRLLFLLQ